jgi:hypothetical protein
MVFVIAVPSLWMDVRPPRASRRDVDKLDDAAVEDHP